MSVQPAFEWYAFDAAAPLAGAERAGAVVRDAAGRARALHFAPQRWLLPQPDDALLGQLLARESSAGGVLCDVTGRWCLLELPSPAAGRHPLQAAAAPELVLRDRDAAALWLFDCPVLLARGAAGFEVWVESSYADGFRAMLDRIEARPQAADA